MTIPKGGTIATTLTNPALAIPLLITVGALILMSSSPPSPRPRSRDGADPQPDEQPGTPVGTEAAAAITVGSPD